MYDTKRAEYVPITDDEAVEAFEYLSRIEGIIPAIESSHALAYARKLAPQMDKDKIIVVNISGRGDKDVAAIARYRGLKSMNKIEDAFKNKKHLYRLLRQDPSLDVTRELILAMQEAGADLIEIGIPFSDPVAEGPVIQEADDRALSAGVTTDKIFDMVDDIADKIHVPIVFMTYINPIYVYGVEKFANERKHAVLPALLYRMCRLKKKKKSAAVLKQKDWWLSQWWHRLRQTVCG